MRIKRNLQQIFSSIIGIPGNFSAIAKGATLDTFVEIDANITGGALNRQSIDNAGITVFVPTGTAFDAAKGMLAIGNLSDIYANHVCFYLTLHEPFGMKILRMGRMHIKRTLASLIYSPLPPTNSLL
jgi:hypothetical protein